MLQRNHKQTFALCLLALALSLVVVPSSPAPMQTAQAQAELPTFVDLPPGATETYSGSGFYKADISAGMTAAVDRQTQDNWTKYNIAKESNLGLPLGSVYVRAQNGKYVELALYERAAFTAFKGQPARQILSTILFEGKIQVSETESVSLPTNIRQSFSTLAIAGEPVQYAPTLANLTTHLSTDPAKAEDASATSIDKLLILDGTFSSPAPSDNVQPLPLGAPDSTTGHRIPTVIAKGLTRLFGEKVTENAGLPVSAAMWLRAKINDQPTVVGVQAFERMMVTYNPANDEANRVQVGLGGAIVWQGLVNAAPPPTPTQPVPTPTHETLSSRDMVHTLTRIRKDNGQPETVTVKFDNLEDKSVPQFLLNQDPALLGDFDILMQRIGQDGHTQITFRVVAIELSSPPPVDKRLDDDLWLDSTGRPNALMRKNGDVIEFTLYSFDKWSIVHDPKQASQWASSVIIWFAAFVASATNHTMDATTLYQQIGYDDIGKRVKHNMGVNVQGLPGNYQQDPWPIMTEVKYQP